MEIINMIYLICLDCKHDWAIKSWNNKEPDKCPECSSMLYYYQYNEEINNDKTTLINNIKLGDDSKMMSNSECPKCHYNSESIHVIPVSVIHGQIDVGDKYD